MALTKIKKLEKDLLQDCLSQETGNGTQYYAQELSIWA